MRMLDAYAWWRTDRVGDLTDYCLYPSGERDHVTHTFISGLGKRSSTSIIPYNLNMEPIEAALAFLGPYEPGKNTIILPSRKDSIAAGQRCQNDIAAFRTPGKPSTRSFNFSNFSKKNSLLNISMLLPSEPYLYRKR
jgi:hypothetical protein